MTEQPQQLSLDEKSLIEALDQLRKPKRSSQKPLRVAVDAIAKIGGVGIVLCGRLETGMIQSNSQVKLTGLRRQFDQKDEGAVY